MAENSNEQRSASETHLHNDKPPPERSDLGAAVNWRDTAPRHDQSQHWLTQTIERQVIPRLLVVHKVKPASAEHTGANPAPAIQPDDVEKLCRMVIKGAVAEAHGFVDDLQSYGVPLDSIYLDLFGPAARRLGDRWVEDELSFMEVTEGLVALHNIAHKIVSDQSAEVERSENSRSILLATAAGEQHMFGLTLVGDCFRRAGWDVWDEPLADAAKVKDLVKSHPFDVIGLSLSDETRLKAFGKEIAALRKAAKGRPAIMVGGWMFVENPDLVKQIGADGTAVHCCDAPRNAERLIGLRLSH